MSNDVNKSAPPAWLAAEAAAISQPPLPGAPAGLQYVIVKNIDMAISSMCIFMIKWAIAAVPAAIILTLLFLFIGALFGGVFRALLH